MTPASSKQDQIERDKLQLLKDFLDQTNYWTSQHESQGINDGTTFETIRHSDGSFEWRIVIPGVDIFSFGRSFADQQKAKQNGKAWLHNRLVDLNAKLMPPSSMSP